MHSGRRTLPDVIVRALLALALLACCARPVSAARLLEITFDDAADLTGPQSGDAALHNTETGLNSLGAGLLTATLTGAARRSVYGAGRYGRAADLPGAAGAVEIAGWSPLGGTSLSLYMWVKARDAQSGHLIRRQGSFDLRLAAGQLALDITTSAGGVSSVPIASAALADGSYHHLALNIDATGAVPVVTLWIDFAAAGTLSLTQGVATGQQTVRLGEGFDGLIDELLVKHGAPTADDLFDFDPAYCPAGASCEESVLAITTPFGGPRQVPVRYKSVWKPQTCTSASPCPLLFDISGGGTCADDYQGTVSVTTLVNAGFFVVTVDPYCDDRTFSPYPAETQQLVAAKTHVLAGARKTLIAGPGYAATGCSHGAGAVTHWALREQDHPTRTFARSPAVGTHCALHAGVICPLPALFIDKMIVDVVGAHDDTRPQVQALHRGQLAADMLSTSLVGSRELAISWGVNLQGPVCSANGSYACYEEGLFGMTYGARRFRDVWHKLEPQGAPTGYFVEDRGADCRHCAASSSVAYQCGVCLLKHGRAGMASACPDCLSYSGATIGAGAAAQSCPINAGWYVDPLTWGPGGPDGGVVDAAPTTDGGSPAGDRRSGDDGGAAQPGDGPGDGPGTRPGDGPAGSAGDGASAAGDGGCSCRVDAAPAELPAWVLVLVGLAAIRRRGSGTNPRAHLS